jgi:glycosyltransferase EpsJ
MEFISMSIISVIIPVYKVENYLKRCLDSILDQTFPDFDCILIDDGSPDNCGKICDEYAKKDKRIIVIHQENSGVSVARNRGLEWAFKNSNSDWISFVDSDDFVDKSFLEYFYEATTKNDVDVVCAGLRYIPSERRLFPAFNIGNVKSGIDMINSNPQVFSNKALPFSFRYFINKKYLIYNNIKFNEKIKYAEDSCFNLRILLDAKAMICIPKISYNYISRDNSATACYKPSLLSDSEYYHSFKMIVADKLSIGKYEYMKDLATVHIFSWLPSIIDNFRNSDDGFSINNAKAILDADFLKDSVKFFVDNKLTNRKMQKFYFFLIQKKCILIYWIWKYFDLNIFVS